MKRTIFLLVMVAISACKSTIAPNLPVEIDFMDPKYPTVQTIKQRQTVELILKNVNPAIYEISVKDSLIVRSTAIPPLFGQIFKIPELNPTATTVPAGEPKITGTSKDEKALIATVKETDNSLSDDLQIFIDAYPAKEKAVKNVLQRSAIADDINNLLTDCNLSLVQLKTKADAYINDNIKSLPSGTFPMGIQSKINEESSSTRIDLEKYIKSGEQLKKQFNAILDKADDDKKMTCTNYKIIEKGVNEKVGAIDKILENCKKLLDKLTAFDEAKVGAAIEENYKKVISSRITKTFLKTPKDDTDELLLDVTIKKKKDILCVNEVTGFRLTAIVTGGVKIDFSTGVVFNLGQNKFFNQTYRYDSISPTPGAKPDKVKIEKNKNNNVVVPSLGAFFHVYSRSLSPINFGGMVGASLGADQRAYIHVGGCVLFGRSQRLIIGGGLSSATANILDSQFHEGQEFNVKYAPSPIPREEATRLGGYISLTWNLDLIK